MIATTENMIAEYATNLYALIRLSKSIPILRGSVIFVPLLWDENYLYCYLEGVGLSESIDTKCVNLSFSMKFVLVISLCKENRLFNEVFFFIPYENLTKDENFEDANKYYECYELQFVYAKCNLYTNCSLLFYMQIANMF